MRKDRKHAIAVVNSRNPLTMRNNFYYRFYYCAHGSSSGSKFGSNCAAPYYPQNYGGDYRAKYPCESIT